MKTIIKLYLLAACLMTFISCNDKNVEINPGTISNLRAEAREGAVMLRWDVPVDSSYFYLKLTYLDKHKNENITKLISLYTDSLLVSGMLQKYGEYQFSIQPYSTTDTPGAVLSISATCEKVKPSYSLGSNITDVALSADMVSTNSQQDDEGPVAQVVDRNPVTYFQSIWWKNVPDTHIQIDLKKPIEGGIRFRTQNRNARADGKPKTVDVLVSTDGENFVKMATFTGLPAAVGALYTSPMILLKGTIEPIKSFRYVLKEVHTGGYYMGLAELWIDEVDYTVYDPENE